MKGGRRQGKIGRQARIPLTRIQFRFAGLECQGVDMIMRHDFAPAYMKRSGSSNQIRNVHRHLLSCWLRTDQVDFILFLVDANDRSQFPEARCMLFDLQQMLKEQSPEKLVPVLILADQWPDEHWRCFQKICGNPNGIHPPLHPAVSADELCEALGLDPPLLRNAKRLLWVGLHDSGSPLSRLPYGVIELIISELIALYNHQNTVDSLENISQPFMYESRSWAFGHDISHADLIPAVRWLQHHTPQSIGDKVVNKLQQVFFTKQNSDTFQS